MSATADQINLIKEAVKAIMPDAISLLKDLVSVETINPPGKDYPKIAEFLDGYLSSKGYISKKIVVPAHLQPDLYPHDNSPRVNVFATLPPDPKGFDNGRVVHFNGHVDVVPVGDASLWSTPPFKLTESNGNLYGRGTSDMKGGIVAQIFAIEALRKAGIPIRGTIEQSAVVDEETTGNRNAGMGYLVEKGYIKKGKQDVIIITEPLNTDNICLGHRGALWGSITFKGTPAHSSTPTRGTNPLLHASLMVAEAHQKITPLLRGRVDPNVIPKEAQSASLTFTIFNAGTNNNTLADKATIVFDRRLVPSESLKTARQEINNALDNVISQFPWDEVKAEITEFYATDAVWMGDSTDPTAQELIAGFEKAIKTVLGVKAGRVSSPGTDDQRFVVRNAGIDACVVYGPGNILNVHNANELVSVKDLSDAIEVMALFTLEFLNKPRQT